MVSKGKKLKNVSNLPQTQLSKQYFSIVVQ